MKLEQQIIMKEIHGVEVYKVLDILNGHVLNVRGVRRIGEELELISSFTEEEFKFLDDKTLGAIHVSELNEKIIQLLREQEQITANNLMTVLNVTSGIDTSRTSTRIVAGHVYALTYHLYHSVIPQIQFAIGDETGKLSYHGPVINDDSIFDAIMLGIYNNPITDSEIEEQFYQTGQSEYLILTKINNTTVIVPVFLQEEDGGSLSWSSNLGYARYIEESDKGVIISNTSTEGFKDDNDMKDFLNKTTEKLTNVLMNA